MTITQSSNNGNTVLRLTGRFDFNSRSVIQTAVAKAQQGGAPHIILNLQGVPYMDSAALGILALMHKQLTAQNIQVTLVNPQPFVKGILELARMDKLFTVHATEEQAMTSLAKA
jgi:anti-sigma B factor antagonist